MDPKARVQHAEKRFREGDVDGFVACFHADVLICAAPERTTEPLARGLDELRARTVALYGGWDVTALQVRNIEAHGDGVVGDVLVVAPADSDEGGWRMAAAVRFQDGLIREVRAFWRRDEAVAELTPSH